MHEIYHNVSLFGANIYIMVGRGLKIGQKMDCLSHISNLEGVQMY